MRYLLKNKRGSQYVEAAIVMPLIIVMIVSCLYLILFFYNFLWSRCEAHEELIRNSEKSEVLYDIDAIEVSEKMIVKGIDRVTMAKSKVEEIYLLNQAKAVRLGDNFDIF